MGHQACKKYIIILCSINLNESKPNSNKND